MVNKKIEEYLVLTQETIDLIPMQPGYPSDQLKKMFQHFNAIGVAFMDQLDIRPELKDIIPANKLGEFYGAVRKIHGTSSFSPQKAEKLKQTVFQIHKIIEDIKNKNEEDEPVENQKPITDDTWKKIKNDFDISKTAFGKKINFITDSYKRKIIFRDIEHAYTLTKTGFYKPAVILSGGVIEEILRLFLEHKGISYSNKTFSSYVKACVENSLLKSEISSLSDSARHFRNLVHLAKEKEKSFAISKSAAQGAVSSIFTLVNGL